jgi:hypothetical protein
MGAASELAQGSCVGTSSDNSSNNSNSRRQQTASVAATAVAEVAFKTKHNLGINSFEHYPYILYQLFLYINTSDHLPKIGRLKSG